MKIAIISTIFLAVYIIIDLIFDTQLWNANTDLTVYLQSHQFNGEQVIFQFFSLSLYIIPAIAALMFLFSDQKLGALLYGSLIVFTTGLNSLLKNVYHQPRPFMSVQSIYSLECSKEYGKPSGHAMGSFIMCFMLPAIMFPGIYRTTNNKQQYPIYVRILVITILCIWVLMTGMSRVFLGVHSFGQILLGWVFSAYISIIYIVYIHDHLFNYITLCLKPEGQGITNKVVVGVSIFTLIWISVSILFLELNINYFVTSQQVNEWLLAVEVKCPLETKLDGKNATVLYNVCFYQTMIMGFILGLVMGVHYSTGRYEEGQFSMNYRNLSLKQKCFRVLLFLSLSFVIAPFFIIQFFTQENVYISSFISFFPTCFMGGFAIVYIFTRLLIYAQLNLQGDLLYLETTELNHSHIKSSKDMDLQMVEIVH